MLGIGTGGGTSSRGSGRAFAHPRRRTAARGGACSNRLVCRQARVGSSTGTGHRRRDQPPAGPWSRGNPRTAAHRPGSGVGRASCWRRATAGSRNESRRCCRCHTSSSSWMTISPTTSTRLAPCVPDSSTKHRYKVPPTRPCPAEAGHGSAIAAEEQGSRNRIRRSSPLCTQSNAPWNRRALPRRTTRAVSDCAHDQAACGLGPSRHY